MLDFIEILTSWWAIILSAVAGLGWLIRLEARGLANEKEIRRLWTQRKEDLQEAKDARASTNEMLREMRSDIKALLARRE